MSDSLQLHELQHTRLPCPSPFPRVCSDSCLLSQWCHPIIWFSVSSCLQSFPASGSFPMSQFFASGGEYYWSFSFSFSFSPSKEYSGLISLGLTGLISLQPKLLSRVFSNTTVQKHQFFSAQPSYMTTGKTIALTRWIFVGKVMSLLFNMLSRFVRIFFQGASVF